MQENELFEEVKEKLKNKIELNKIIFDSAFANTLDYELDCFDQGHVKTLTKYIDDHYIKPVKSQKTNPSPESELKLRNFTGSNKELDEADEWQTRNILYLSLIDDTIKELKLKDDHATELAAKYLSFITGWNKREARQYLTENKTPNLSPITYDIELSDLRLGHPGKITLTIDPRVDPEDVRKTYNKAISELKKWTAVHRYPHNDLTLKLIKFVLKTPGLSWQERFTKWQKEYPKDKNNWKDYKSMQITYSKARKTLLKGIGAVNTERLGRWLNEAKEDLLLASQGQIPFALEPQSEDQLKIPLRHLSRKMLLNDSISQEDNETLLGLKDDIEFMSTPENIKRLKEAILNFQPKKEAKHGKYPKKSK